MYQYYILNKPYEMLSQFTGGHPGLRMLGDLGYPFPDGIHAVGRLDYHSEGLLLLTTNPAVTRLLFQGPERHCRTYLVQAYKAMPEATVDRLRQGVVLRVRGGVDYITRPCTVVRTERPAGLPAAAHELPPAIPQTWLVLTLTEGKYRQIRKMLTAVGHKCRRLIRLSIEELALQTLPPGAVQELPEADFFRLLHIGQGGWSKESSGN